MAQRRKFVRFLNCLPNVRERTYADAVTALNTLQSNHAIVEAIRKSTGGLNKFAIPEMLEWLRKCSYQPSDFSQLNVVHIAGTKGKGSTAAFISSILSQYLPSTSFAFSPLFRKIGLYTSPHLRFVRERIQINNKPVSEEVFARCFFEIWDRFEAADRQAGTEKGVSAKPAYFRYLTIMALHHYLQEGVDSAIIECGIGGEYDSTNVFMKPTVTGITPLGLDHTAMLGNTISSIAWHKGGIMKFGAEAYTAPQTDQAMAVLRSRAGEKGTQLHVVQRHPQIADGSVALGLFGDFQKDNASLAVEVAAAHLRALGNARIETSVLPPKFVRGLGAAQLGGRCESRLENRIEWYIDGGHTLESVRVAAEWYVDRVFTSSHSRSPSPWGSSINGQQPRRPPRILIFNQQKRAGLPLLRELHGIIALAQGSDQPFDYAIFCSNITSVDSGYRPDLVSINSDLETVGGLDVQYHLADGWARLCKVDGEWKRRLGGIAVVRTVEEAVAEARAFERRSSNGMPEIGARAQVLVTGSMHLVGGILEILETETINDS